MTGKEELRQIFRLDKRMVSLHDSIIELETKLTRVSPILSDMPRGGGEQDKISGGVAKLCELRQMLDDMLTESCIRRGEIIKKIELLDNENYKTILRERYVNLKSFEQISIMFPYTYNHTLKLHGHALQEYAKLKD